MTETETSTTAPAAETTKTPTQEEAASPQEEVPAVVEETNGDGAEAATNGDSKAEPEPPKEMRAIVLTGFGGFKAVKIQKKPEPAPAADEVLIRVKACGLSFQDLMMRLGAIDSPPKTPCIMGVECAGEIEAVGESVTKFAVGDRVVALPEYKGWAELAAVPEKFVYKIPDELPFADATAIALPFVVAHILVYDLANIQPGRSVLVHSVGGAVGQAIGQLCKNIGDVELFGIASKNKHEAIEATGLVTHLLERGADYLSEVRKVSSDGVDIVLDCLYGEECNRGYSLLKPMGKYVLYGSANLVTGGTKSYFNLARSWWQVDKVSPIKLFDENKSVTGFNLRHLLYQQDGSEYIRKTVEKVFDLWKDGKIKPVIDSTWAIEDVAEAMQKLHDRKNIGKVVLDPAQTPKPKPATPAKGKGKKQASEDKSGDKDKKTEPTSPTSPTEENGEDAAALEVVKCVETEKVTNGDAEPKATNGDASDKEKQSS